MGALCHPLEERCDTAQLARHPGPAPLLPSPKSDALRTAPAGGHAQWRAAPCRRASVSAVTAITTAIAIPAAAAAAAAAADIPRA